MKNTLIRSGLVILSILLVGGILLLNKDQDVNSKDIELKKFNSYNEFVEYVNKTNTVENYADSASTGSMLPSIAKAEAAGSSVGERAGEYSQTNIQVEGVDEPDIVKNDGKYIYTVIGNKVVIVDSFPAENMEIVSEIELKNKNPLQIFVNGNKLIVFATGYEQVVSGEGAGDDGVTNAKSNGKIAGATGAAGAVAGAVGAPSMIVPGPWYGGNSKVYVLIYDIKDKKNPKLENEYTSEGYYIDSRMISDYVYVITSKNIDFGNIDLPVFIADGVKTTVSAEEIYYFDYSDNSYSFTSVMAVDLNEDEYNVEVYLTGSSNNIYVSEENIFLTNTKTISEEDKIKKMIEGVILKILPEEEKEKVKDILDSNDESYNKMNKIEGLLVKYSNSLKGEEKARFDKEFKMKLEKFQLEMVKEFEKTVIHKININEKDIEYIANGEVPGHALNQFSMDENKKYFRIATTTGEVWNGNSLNHIFVLNKDLEIVGSIEDLAKGEKIYSARFIGDRAYMVTFKKVDPFYVIDLKNPENPKVLGYLKIPGFSDYLHPYDENHIIGIGKEAVDAGDELMNARGIDFAWYQGLKISIFDVTDVEKPKQTAKIVIGDRGTDSLALSDHKAFLFDKKKHLLVIPVSLAEINKETYKDNIPDNAYGEMVWQGAYILNIDTNDISVKGRVSHNDYEAKYGPAKDEPIGSIRVDYEGNIWTKKESNKWIIEAKDRNGEWVLDIGGYKYPTGNRRYDDIIYGDSVIDGMPGGIKFRPDIYNYNTQIQRSLYMDDILYTLSLSKIKASDLDSLGEINSVDLPANNVFPVIYEY